MGEVVALALAVAALGVADANATPAPHSPPCCCCIRGGGPICRHARTVCVQKYTLMCDPCQTRERGAALNAYA